MKYIFNFLGYLMARFKSESPTFFKRLLLICLVLDSLALAIIAAKSQFPEYFTWINNDYIGYILVTGLVGAAISKLTAKDPPPDPNSPK